MFQYTSTPSKEILSPPVQAKLDPNEQSHAPQSSESQIDSRVLSPIHDFTQPGEPFSTAVPIFCSPEPKAFLQTTPDCSFIPVKKPEFNGQFPITNSSSVAVANPSNANQLVRLASAGGFFPDVTSNKSLIANKLTFSANQGPHSDLVNIFAGNESDGTPLCAKQLLVLDDNSSTSQLQAVTQSGQNDSVQQQRQQKTPKTFKIGIQREENAAGACNTSEFKTTNEGLNMMQTRNPNDTTAPFTMALTEKKQLPGRNGAVYSQGQSKLLGSAGKKQLQSAAKNSANSNDNLKNWNAGAQGLRKRTKKTGHNGLQLNDFYPQQIQLNGLLPQNSIYEGEDLYADILTATSNQPTSACQQNSVSMLTISKMLPENVNTLEAAPVLANRKKLLNFTHSTDENGSQPLDRFIPSRLQDNLQGKFEAVSVNTVEYLRTQENIPSNAQQQANGSNYQNIFGSTQASNSVLQLPQISLTAASSVHEQAAFQQIQLAAQKQKQQNQSDQSAEQSSNSQNFATYSEMLEESIFSLAGTGSGTLEMMSMNDGYTNLTTDFKDSTSAIPTSYQTQQRQQTEPVRSTLKDSAVLNFKRQWSGPVIHGHYPSECVLSKQSSDYMNSTSDDLTPLMSSNKFRESYNNSGSNVSSQNNTQRIVRKIAAQPFRILDAPHLTDDFYLNLVDWSASNQLAVALDKSVYIYNANTAQVSELANLGDLNQVTSVSWSSAGGRTGNNYLSVGTLEGHVQIWDVNCQKMVHDYDGHFHRVGATAWQDSLIASGSKDKTIRVRDLRQQNTIQILQGHRQEVCGLRWSPHDQNMLASGGNDNKLMLWQVGQNGNQPIARFGQHNAAVKAINWSPLHRGLLATGGGTADQCIRFWNTLTMQPLKCVNTGSQVCNLVFSKTNDELVSTHGYSLNQVIVWKYPTMEKIATLTGHTYRVLYLAMSPDGSSIVTGAGDETLRFWNVFPKSRSNQGVLDGNDIVGSGTSSLFPSNNDFR